MNKFFRIVAEKKFYCNEKGILLKNAEGEFDEVPETDTDTEEYSDEGSDAASVESAAKMIKEAAKQVGEQAQRSIDEKGKAAVDAVARMFDALTEKAKAKTTAVNLESQHKASFNAEEVKKDIASAIAGKSKTVAFKINTKADLEYLEKTLSESASLEGDVLEGTRVPELTRDPVRRVFIEQIADTNQMTTEYLSYVEVVDEEGAPLPTAELGDILEKDFEFQEFRANLKKITVANKHSVEILKDGPQLVAAIKRWLEEDVNIVTDQLLLTGNGEGENPLGVFNVASELDSAAIGAKRVPYANLYDVIRVALTKIAVSGKGNFIGNYVLLNPNDADALDLTKDSEGRYVLPPFKSADGTTIKGARVIENVGIPTGKFLVGDFSKFHVGVQGGVEIEMTNSDGGDFLKDILTVKLRRRVASYARQNDNGAFWTGDIAEVIVALSSDESPSE